MNTANDADQTMYGISRIDDPVNRAYAWRVSLCRHNKRHVKNFTDRRCGGKSAALKQAQQYRDELITNLPPITRKEFSNSKRRNNKTGITGVYKYCKSYVLRDGTIKENWYWEANWPAEVGKSFKKSFAVRRYGDELAKQMAIRARNDGMKSVSGTFWAAERGLITTVDTNLSSQTNFKQTG